METREDQQETKRKSRPVVLIPLNIIPERLNPLNLAMAFRSKSKNR
jgi:hypothetical protein